MDYGNGDMITYHTMRNDSLDKKKYKYKDQNAVIFFQ